MDDKVYTTPCIVCGSYHRKAKVRKDVEIRICSGCGRITHKPLTSKIEPIGGACWSRGNGKAEATPILEGVKATEVVYPRVADFVAQDVKVVQCQSLTLAVNNDDDRLVMISND